MSISQLPLAVREALLDTGFDHSGTNHIGPATINVSLSSVFADILIVRITPTGREGYVHRLDLNHLATLSRESLSAMFGTITQFSR